LRADPPDAAPGQSVRLIAQLQFQGDYKPKDGIHITFTGGESAAYFGNAARHRTSEEGVTDGMGAATEVLTLDETVATRSEKEFDDLDGEKRRLQEDQQPNAVTSVLAAAGTGASPAANLGSIGLRANGAGFSNGTTILARKPDIKFIDYIVRKYNLDQCQRRLLHDEITGQHLTEDKIEEIAEEISKSGRGKCPKSGEGGDGN
jgi:hypothetical protein